ncbi:MAG: 6-bladed beta-propeller, partial [Verrucomicrobiota bacterium]|nr:6-bladed beta-propeller [Verrucomicrobiota bacterium]
LLLLAMPRIKRVVAVKPDGTVVWQIIGPPSVPGMYGSRGEYNPTDVGVTLDGRIYIVDGYGKSLVHIYDKNRNYVKSFGGKGKEDGKFDICHNILIDTRSGTPTLLISDRQNNRLQQHDLEGKFLRTIDAGLGRPCAADIHGDLLAVGELDGRVSLYDRDYKLISRLGDENKDRKKASNQVGPEHWHAGDLVAVHGCTFDAKGDLYAQEWNVHGRVIKYTRVK